MPRALLAALLLSLSQLVVAADLAVAVEVPADKSKTVRLRNLPAGATMVVRITTNGKLLIALVSEKRQALFRAAVEHRLSFRVTIREPGDYYLVLSNRGGTKPLEVQAEIRAVGAARPAPVPRPDKALFRPAGKGEQIA